MGRCCWLVYACLLAGCIEPQLQRCGENLCAIDAVCLPNGLCASHDALAACDGLPDGAQCSTTVFTGTCVEGACTAPRCGDGVVSGSEQCDGTVSGVDCVEYGFDTGIPTCSASCTLDVVGSCVRFGWKRIYTDAVSRMWTSGTRLALITGDRRAVKVYESMQLVQTLDADIADGELFWEIEGNGDTLAVASSDRFYVSTAGGPFTPMTTIEGVEDMQIADDGTIYTISYSEPGCRVYRGSPQTMILQNAVDICNDISFTGGQLYLGFDDGLVQSYTGSGWTPVGNYGAPVEDVTSHDGALWIATWGNGVYKLDGTTTTHWDVGTIPAIIATPFGVFAGGDSSEIRRLIELYSETIDAPTLGYFTSDGTHLFEYGNGIYQFTGTQFARRVGVNPVKDLSMLADGTIAMTDHTAIAIMYNDGGWDYFQPSDDYVDMVAGSSYSSAYVASTEGYLARFGGNTFTDVPILGNPTALNDIAWLESTSTLIVVGPGQLGLARVNTTWMTLTPPAGTVGCDLLALAVNGTDVYAVGACASQGVIWSLAGTTWTEIRRGAIALESIWVDPNDNVYAVGAGGLVRRIGGQWTEDASIVGSSVSATTPDDIWIGGGTQELVHWDGTIWSRVGIVGASSPQVLATPRAVYFGGASRSVLLR